MEVVIVSRHKSTIKLLKQYFPEAKVIGHLSNPNDIPSGSLVIGNLPIETVAELLKRGCRFVSVVLNIPPELRGKELGEEELRRYMKLKEIVRLELSDFIIA